MNKVSVVEKEGQLLKLELFSIENFGRVELL